jgi:dihydrofolate reductase
VPRTVYYAAVSADGFIADAQGGVAWLDAYNAPELGYDQFLAGVGAVVLGRATYEQALTFGPWPYEGRQALVVSSKPIAKLPALARVVSAAELPGAIRAFDTPKDRWIVGGGRTARIALDAGLIDELELYVVPHLVGQGVPLFAPGKPAALKLLESMPFSNGIVLHRYSARAA